MQFSCCCAIFFQIALSLLKVAYLYISQRELEVDRHQKILRHEKEILDVFRGGGVAVAVCVCVD